MCRLVWTLRLRAQTVLLHLLVWTLFSPLPSSSRARKPGRLWHMPLVANLMCHGLSKPPEASKRHQSRNTPRSLPRRFRERLELSVAHNITRGARKASPQHCICWLRQGSDTNEDGPLFSTRVRDRSPSSTHLPPKRKTHLGTPTPEN
ncbi:hypothetical protein BJ546DRAFT_531103 [Cryomyces antarcticus]